jgi:hypothetical protein
MRTENGWVIDENNNRASLEKWGSEEAAANILATLTGCSGCSDCSGCSGKKNEKLESPIPVIEDIHKKLADAMIILTKENP